MCKLFKIQSSVGISIPVWSKRSTQGMKRFLHVSFKFTTKSVFFGFKVIETVHPWMKCSNSIILKKKWYISTGKTPLWISIPPHLPKWHLKNVFILQWMHMIKLINLEWYAHFLLKSKCFYFFWMLGEVHK